jgi:hypothetical protein
MLALKQCGLGFYNVQFFKKKHLQCYSVHDIFYIWPQNINAELEKKLKKELALNGWM